MRKSILLSAFAFVLFNSTAKAAESSEIYCTIRNTGANLSCQWVGKEGRKAMGPDDILQFIDRAEVAAYISIKSRKGHERLFFIDSNSAPFRKLSEIKSNGSISEISKAKNEIFADVEKKAIKISDDLDAQMETSDYLKYDNSIAVDKFKRELYRIDQTNRTFEKGPETVAAAPVGEGYFSKDYKMFVGVDVSNIVVEVGNRNNVTQTSYNIGARKFWNDKWYNEIELRSGAATDYPQTSSFAIGRGLLPTYSDLKTYYCMENKTWCFGLIVANIAYVTGKTTAMNLYTDSFAELGFEWISKWGNWDLVGTVSTGQGLGYTSSNNGTQRVNSETIIDAEFDMERYWGQHGVQFKANYEQIYAAYSTGAPLTNTRAGLLTQYIFKF